jgi:hypothetical protein
LNDRCVVAWEVVLGQQLANFHLHQLEQLGVVHHVALVQENDDVRHAHLSSQQDVLAGLGHGAVSSGAHQNGAVHLSRASDHVLHIVGVAWAVNVCVVTVGCLVLNVRCVNGNAASLLFRGCVNLVVRFSSATKLGCQHCCDRSCQCCFTVVNVTNGANVHVRFCPLKFLFCHFSTPKKTLKLCSKSAQKNWCPWRESDPRSPPYQGGALPLSHKGDLDSAQQGTLSTLKLHHLVKNWSGRRESNPRH